MANVTPQQQWWKNWYNWFYSTPPVSPWQSYAYPQYSQQYTQQQYMYPTSQYMPAQPYQPVVTQQYAAPTVVQTLAQIKRQCALQGGVYRNGQCIARPVAARKQCIASGNIWRGNKCVSRTGAVITDSGVTGATGTTAVPVTVTNASGQPVTVYVDPNTGQQVSQTTPTVQTTTPSGQGPAVENIPDMTYDSGYTAEAGSGYESLFGLGKLGGVDMKTVAIIGAVGLGLYLLMKKGR